MTASRRSTLLLRCGPLLAVRDRDGLFDWLACLDFGAHVLAESGFAGGFGQWHGCLRWIEMMPPHRWRDRRPKQVGEFCKIHVSVSTPVKSSLCATVTVPLSLCVNAPRVPVAVMVATPAL